MIGRINEQGIYESDMEEELKRIQKHEKQGRIRQRFSRVMKKLVGGEDEVHKNDCNVLRRTISLSLSI